MTTGVADRVRFELELVIVGEASAARKMDELGLDSLDFVQLHHDLEEEFKIQVGIEQLAECDTVGDLIELIESKCA